MSIEKTFIENLEEKLLHPILDLSDLSAEQQHERIMARVGDIPESVISPDDLLERLRLSKKTGVPLSVKFGIDPTGPDIHIGHAVPLINLRLFQRMGHKVKLVIGDFTGMIGDPSGRDDARAALTREDIERNMITYENQASRIIDLRDPIVEKHYNSKWMDQLTMRSWVEIIKHISASALLQRDDFRKRLTAGQGFSIAEMEYAIFMGYDSVMLNPDIEMGGVDQYLNMHMCRQMMANAGQKPEIVISYNLLSGTTGEKDAQERFIKMSKSRGNYIPITADPPDMYGKVMSIPDEVMWIWYRELTEITPEDLVSLKAQVLEEKIHPKSAKQLLARTIVGIFNNFDAEIIRLAEDDFNSKFGKHTALIPEDMKTIPIVEGESLIETLARASGESKGYIRRLVQQQGIRFLKDAEYIVLSLDNLNSPGQEWTERVVSVGKRHYYKLTK
jgi:tyrosyl-tRNA synthetase